MLLFRLESLKKQYKEYCVCAILSGAVAMNGFSMDPDNRDLIPQYLPMSSRYDATSKNIYSRVLHKKMKESGCLDIYSDYEKIEKTIGRHPGFILENKETGRRIYFKTEVDIDRQALILSILSQFMNAPETKLHEIYLEVGASLNYKYYVQKLYYVSESKDLSRSYQKDGRAKKRTFIPFGRLHRWSKNSAIDFKSILTALDNDEKLLVSLVKFKLLTIIFKLHDYEGDNSGFLKLDFPGGKVCYKIAIVDCDIEEKFCRPSSTSTKFSDLSVHNLTKHLCEDEIVISKEHFQKAIEEILFPKKKFIDPADGYLKVKKGERGDFRSTLNAVFDNYINVFPKDELNSYLEYLEKRCVEIVNLIKAEEF